MILCGGEALFDMTPEPSGDGVLRFAAHPGGAIFNTARALGRLGVPVGFLGGLPRDFLGERLAASLRAAGVDIALSPRFDRPATLAFVERVDGAEHYAFYDENTALRALTPLAIPDLPEEIRVLFLGGISLAGEPCGSAYEALALREAGSRMIMLDPNPRPSIIADEAAYRARLDRMVAVSDVVKLSSHDLAWLSPDLSVDDAARKVMRRGPALVLVTMGGEGAMALRVSGETLRIDAAPVAVVVDTIGAGDVFSAGFLTALVDAGVETRAALEALDDGGLRTALSFAARAAAATLGHPGAHAPTRDEV